jgi:hypothetical protein
MKSLFILFLLLNTASAQSVEPGDERLIALSKLKKLVRDVDSVIVKGKLLSYHVKGIHAFGAGFGDVQLFFDEKDRVKEIWMDAVIDSCIETMQAMERGIPKGQILHTIHSPNSDILLVRAPEFDMAAFFQCNRSRLRLEITEIGKNRRFGDL